jgi:cell division protein FtsQ
VSRVSQSVLSLPRRRPPALLRALPSVRTIAIAGALLLAAIGLYALARETAMFAIRSVSVESGPPALRAEVRNALASFRGKSLTSLNGAAVIGRVEDLPSVVSASYDRDFPHTLRIRVVPERPVAVVRSGAASWVASARGRVVRTVERGALASLPRIWLPPGARIDPGSFLSGDAGAAARALHAFVSSRFARRALWARLRDGQLTVGLRSGLELRLGPPTDLPLKIAVVRGVLPTLALPAAGGPTYLDVSVPDRPVAGTDPQPAG